MSKKNILDELGTFSNINSDTLERIIRTGKIIDVPKGTVLLHKREPITAVYFQVSGKSIVYNLTHAGK